jgi:hypothetical protein
MYGRSLRKECKEGKEREGRKESKVERKECKEGMYGRSLRKEGKEGM